MSNDLFFLHEIHRIEKKIEFPSALIKNSNNTENNEEGMQNMNPQFQYSRGFGYSIQVVFRITYFVDTHKLHLY